MLCAKYASVLSTSLNSQPALLPPMILKVDEQIWKVNSNRGAARNQTDIKQAEIKRQISHMVDIGVILASQAEYYSQVHLTPKPNKAWRFCIDYRALNTASQGMGWPIPNIPEMLQRLGAKRPKYFAKIDLTNGYHQAPLSVDSRVHTAFTTHMGVYEWLRVPMGLKGAPAYFQEAIAGVLRGLLYDTCELYIDDIIVHGQTKEEFLHILEEVFKRLAKHKITVNPKKCLIGHNEVEFVGHVVNEHGLSFSRDRIEKVMDIKEPVYGKELKAFLGVAGYFHAHIRDYATVSRPLHKMIQAYERNRKLSWTEEGRTAFHTLKKAINECPKLFFVKDGSPIFLHTDASDFGVGGYLFQVVDGEEQPIAFVSKNVDKGRTAVDNHGEGGFRNCVLPQEARIPYQGSNFHSPHRPQKSYLYR